jgi:deoxyribodipyrimidine photolyase-related protein
MSIFLERLKTLKRDPGNRRWIYVPYDQLTDRFGPLAEEDPRNLGLIFLECPAKAGLRPYHQQKLALILTNMRHFALEQARRGAAVQYRVTDGPYKNGLEALFAKTGPIEAMRPAERELRQDLEPLVQAGKLTYLDHGGWLSTTEQFRVSQKPNPPWRMDAFYRHMRRENGILMNGPRPVGGKFSFDQENRRFWSGSPPAPDPPRFKIDPLKKEVGRLIKDHFDHHPGNLDLAALPGTKEEARQLWDWAKHECLPWFGPFEDAMSTSSANLFHTRISMLLNIHRLSPGEVLADVLDMDLPLASREGFIRQVLGWREFVRHVHETTDGFRHIPGMHVPHMASPGDGGWHRWSGRPWPRSENAKEANAGAPNRQNAKVPLPPAYWGRASGLACLDWVVAGVWREGWSHHITRLMVLGNIAALLDVNPRELCDWFWCAYVDAFDWVVEPNVMGMSSFAAGDLMVTKPYISGAGYISRMSDYCRRCAFHPKKNCPLNRLYWAYLVRHESRLQGINRLRPVLAGLKKRDAALKKKDARVFKRLTAVLTAGEQATPEAGTLTD